MISWKERLRLINVQKRGLGAANDLKSNEEEMPFPLKSGTFLEEICRLLTGDN